MRATKRSGGRRRTGRRALPGALCIALALTLNGCSLMLTDYTRPELENVATYARSQEFTGQRLDKDFYTLFEDPALNTLMEQALKANFDLREAYLNVTRAGYELGAARTSLLPDANASAGANLSRDLSSSDSSDRSSSSSLGLSYEVDLFSRLEAARLSSFENLKATAFDYLAMRLSVISGVGSAYWQYAYAREALALGEAELADAQKRLDIVGARYRAGAVDGLEYDTARVDYLTVKESYQSRVEALAHSRTALDYLLGQGADREVNVSALDTAQLPDITLNVPAALLARRPDLMAAEARLREAYYNADEASLAYYPVFNLSLNAVAGDSTTFGRFLSDPVGSLGAALTFPFVNYADLYYAEKASLVDRELAQLAFINTYLTAVREVYDLSESVAYYREAIQTTADSYALARRNYDRYAERYRLGAASLTDFLNASDTLRSAAIAYLDCKRGHLEALMNLMVALGGGLNEASLEEVLSSLEDSAQP